MWSTKPDPRNGKEEILPGKFSHFLVHPGETVVFLTAGGGGYGDACERDRAAIKKDLDLGYISPARAQLDYARNKIA